MYADPGSGVFFLQVLSAGFLTVAYRFRKALASFFHRSHEVEAPSSKKS